MIRKWYDYYNCYSDKLLEDVDFRERIISTMTLSVCKALINSNRFHYLIFVDVPLLNDPIGRLQ